MTNTEICMFLPALYSVNNFSIKKSFSIDFEHKKSWEMKALTCERWWSVWECVIINSEWAGEVIILKSTTLLHLIFISDPENAAYTFHLEKRVLKFEFDPVGAITNTCTAFNVQFLIFHFLNLLWLPVARPRILNKHF
jgi:hypothetical protein